MPVRIVNKIVTVISEDDDQTDQDKDSTEVLDDSTQSKISQAKTILVPGADYVTVPLPMGAARVGFLQIETDAPILCRLNGAGEFPIAPLIDPPISNILNGPNGLLPNVQKGILTLRSGILGDGITVSLTSVEVKCPGYAAAVRVTMVGE